MSTARQARRAQCALGALTLLASLAGSLPEASAQRAEPAPAPAAGRSAEQPVAAEPSAAEPAAEQVWVRRMSDIVAVREGPLAVERVLYYFDPIALLVQGDHVEQGSGGQSEIVLSGGSELALRATGHLILERIAVEGDVLRFPLLTRLDARSVERPLELVLPGGTRALFQGTRVVVLVEPGRMLVRNDGGQPVRLVGDLRLMREDGSEDGTPGLIDLQRGEQALIRLFAALPEPEGGERSLWGVLAVRHPAGVILQAEESLLRLTLRDGTGSDAWTTVGGVRTLAGIAGLRLQNPRHRQVHAEIPPPPADESAAAGHEDSADGLIEPTPDGDGQP